MIWNQSDYIMEVKKLLNDKTVYKDVNFDNGYLIIGYLTVHLYAAGLFTTDFTIHLTIHFRNFTID